GYIPQLMVRSANGVTVAKLPFTYDENECRLRFNIFKVQNNAGYELVLQSVPAASNSNNAGGMVTNTTTTDAGDSVQITGNSATDVVRADTGKTLLNYAFHSSRYGTFAEKMQNIQPGNSAVWKLSSDLFTLQQGVTGAEPLDLSELAGTDYTDNVPLVQPLAVTDDESFRSFIYPLNYKNYPVAGDIVISKRDTAELGFVPVRSLPVSLAYQSLVSQGNFTDPVVTGYLPYLYDLPRIYKQDFLDLQSQVVNRYLGTPQQKNYEWLINGYYPIMKQGYYKVNYQFIIPGGIKGSSHIVQYYNPIN
ncbi:MAG TPA: hypothetical protein VGE79_01760, partial [Niastella sp.]